jgi:hypothetical protein
MPVSIENNFISHESALTMTDTIPFDTNFIFPTWCAFRAQIEDWAVAEHFGFQTFKKDRGRASYRCRDRADGCNWMLYAAASTINHDGDRENIRITSIDGRHTCAGTNQTPRDIHNTQSWLRRTVPKHLFVTRDTTVREIIESIQMHYDVRVSNEAARITRAALINNRKSYQSEQFKKIPA